MTGRKGGGDGKRGGVEWADTRDPGDVPPPQRQSPAVWLEWSDEGEAKAQREEEEQEVMTV